MKQSESEAISKCPNCDRVALEVEETLAGCRKQVKDEILLIQQLTETEVLSIGENVNKIVTHARQYIENSKTALGKTFGEQTKSLDKHIETSQGTINKQNSSAKEALTMSDDISEAGKAVDKLAREAKLLALNATIEASHLGGSGSAFGIISEEMNHLSDEIAKANRLISDATNAIRVCLPDIMKQATLQMETLKIIIESIHQLKDTIQTSLSTTNTAGDTHLDLILNLANSTLSHLQFQDPITQKLQRIDTLMKGLQDSSRTDGEIPSSEEPGLFSRALSKDGSLETKEKINPGEVTLF
ncbi:MAG: methyl-accepting chemotaxis protein [Nitrospiria bacterium]